MDLNKATIIGRLTRDPEVKTIPSGQTVTSFSVATNFAWSDQSGQKQDRTEFHNVVMWRKLAEIAGQYLRKGSRVYIEGRLQTRSWDDQNGTKRFRTEIIADNMIMLDSKGSSQQGSTPAPTPTEAPPTQNNDSGEEEINVEDIPF